MSKLVKLTTPKFEYDWDVIEDFGERTAAKTAVESYQKSHELRVKDAQELVQEDNLAKAKCVYTLKESLNHGQFRDVCQQALGLNKDSAAALASTGKMLIHGDHKEEVLEMVKVMEPRAAQKFLVSDEETKCRYVETFEETGKTPSQRDFQKPSNKPPTKKKMETYTSEPSPIVSPTHNEWEAKQRMEANRIRLLDAVKALTIMLSEVPSCKAETQDVLCDLVREATRLTQVSIK